MNRTGPQRMLTDEKRNRVEEPLVDDEGGLRPAGRLNKGTVSFYDGTRREN